MQKETFDEVFTYVGKAPAPTPQEMEEDRQMLLRAKADWKRWDEWKRQNEACLVAETLEE